MGLFGAFSKPKKTAMDKQLDVMAKIHRDIAPLERKMSDFALSARNARNVDSRIRALEGLVKTFYAIKSKCKSMGVEYTRYFSETWEHCHNSKSKDFCYVTAYEAELADLKSRREDLLAAEKVHGIETKDLKGRLKTFLRNKPGIKQTDVYKEFGSSAKPDIQEALYFMAKNGEILRVKSGNTYVIY